MAAPSVIENDKGIPTYISPTAKDNLRLPSTLKRIPVNIGTSIEPSMPLSSEYLEGYAFNRLGLDPKTP
jgi:hypothetical protein